MRQATKLFSFLASLALAVSYAPAFADTATPAPTPAATPAAPTVTVDGLVDTYFTYNFTNAAHAGFTGTGNTGLYGFNQTDNSFRLGLAEATLTATQGAVSGHLTVDYGETADLLGGTVGQPFVEQAYVSYTSGAWTFNAGKFVTWMGNEVIESKSNWNYSRSLLFFAIPLYHTGVSVNYTTSDSKLALTGYAVNGWNTDTALDFGGEKTFGLNATIKPGSDLTVVLNGIAGPSPSVLTGPADDSLNFVGEGIVTWNATDKLSLCVDAEYFNQDNSFGPGTADGVWGVALYGRYQMASDWAAALRIEELSDNLGGSPAVSADLREATLTIEHNLTANTLFRLEGRYDYQLAGGTTLPQGSGTWFADGDIDQLTATASTVFSF